MAQVRIYTKIFKQNARGSKLRYIAPDRDIQNIGNNASNNIKTK